MEIRKAQKSKSKLRIGLSGTSGSGKTYSALLLANGLVGDWTKVCVIDTEQGSADLYEALGDYLVITLAAPFTPEKYAEAIHMAEQAGMGAIIIDSVTHVWKGEGGLLEFNTKLGGRYQDWAKTTPRYQAFLQAILQSSAHVITTVRKKTAYAMTTEDGRTKVEKKGLDDEIRDGFEYELTSSFSLNQSHLAETSKDRTGLFMGKPEFVINEDTGKTFRDWAEKGVEAIAPYTPATKEQKERLREFMGKGLLDPAFEDRLDEAKFLKTQELIKRLEIQEEAKAETEAAEIQKAQETLEKTRAASKAKAKAAPVEESAEVAA
jgi:hypothetical protein